VTCLGIPRRQKYFSPQLVHTSPLTLAHRQASPIISLQVAQQQPIRHNVPSEPELNLPANRLRMANPARHISTALAILVVAIVVAPVFHLFHRVLSLPETISEVLRDPVSWSLLGRSVLLAAVVAGGSIVLGTALAWLTVRPRWGGEKLGTSTRLGLTVLLCSTLIMPSYVLAFGLIAATGVDGFLAKVLPADYHVRATPLLSSAIALICCTYPYVLLSVRSTLLRECGSLEEAALSMGASRFHAFRTVTLPRIAPGMIWGGMLAGLYALSDFGAVSLLNYDTLTWGIYSRYESPSLAERDEASVLCLMLASVTILFIALMRFVQPELIMPTSATAIGQSHVRLRILLIPAVLLIAAPAAVGLLLPISAVMDWLMRSDAPGELITAAGPAAITTLRYAAVAAIVVPILALPLATLHLSRGKRTGRILTPLTLIGFALPGLVIAIAGAGLALQADALIERFMHRFASGAILQDQQPVAILYQSHIVVLLAYATLFLPEAAGPMRSSAARVHPEQLDAAAQLNTSTFMNWRRIALPQMMPGIAAGAALVFVTTAKELPATLILAPPNVETLATRLWSAMDEAMFATSAAAALLLLLVGAFGLAIFLLLERIGRPSPD
jgi:iron(III) transport system permease protein